MNLYDYSSNDPINLVDPSGLLVTYYGVGGSSGIGGNPEGDKVNYVSLSGVRYYGPLKGGGSEKGGLGQIGAGRITGSALGVGFVAGFQRGYVEDLTGEGLTIGVAVLFINIELTFGDNDALYPKWTGLNIGIFKSFGFGLYGMQTLSGRVPILKYNEPKGESSNDPC